MTPLEGAIVRSALLGQMLLEQEDGAPQVAVVGCLLGQAHVGGVAAFLGPQPLTVGLLAVLVGNDRESPPVEGRQAQQHHHRQRARHVDRQSPARLHQLVAHPFLALGGVHQLLAVVRGIPAGPHRLDQQIVGELDPLLPEALFQAQQPAADQQVDGL